PRSPAKFQTESQTSRCRLPTVPLIPEGSSGGQLWPGRRQMTRGALIDRVQKLGSKSIPANPGHGPSADASHALPQRGKMAYLLVDYSFLASTSLPSGVGEYRANRLFASFDVALRQKDDPAGQPLIATQ